MYLTAEEKARAAVETIDADLADIGSKMIRFAYRFFYIFDIHLKCFAYLRY